LHEFLVVFRHTKTGAGLGRKQFGVRRARIGRVRGAGTSKIRLPKFLRVLGWSGQNFNQRWTLHCGTAAPPIFMQNFLYTLVFCFTLTFSFARTKHFDNVSSLHKPFGKRLNIRHLFVFVWEAL